MSVNVMPLFFLNVTTVYPEDPNSNRVLVPAARVPLEKQVLICSPPTLQGGVWRGTHGEFCNIANRKSV